MSEKVKTPTRMLRYSKSWYLYSRYVFFVQKLFYKKITAEGLENIPMKTPLIYAPNHQNALLDPLLIIATCKRQIVFLTRADVFLNKFVTKFFNWLKILPVYQIREGRENLPKNYTSFDQIIDVLEHNMPTSLFPEGKTNNKRHILKMRKAAPKIGFEAEARNDFKLGVQILPVGIYYSNYNAFRSIAHIRYGEPIDIAKYKDLYLENPQKAYTALNEDVFKGISDLSIDIRNLELYNIFESLRVLYTKQAIKKFRLNQAIENNRFRADKITVAALEDFAEENKEEIQVLAEEVEEFEALKKEYRLSNINIERTKKYLIQPIAYTLLLLPLLPIFIYGFINNALVYFIPKGIVTRVQNVQFHSSFKLGFLILLSPIFYLLQALAVYFIFKIWWVALIYLLTTPFLGLFAQLYFEWVVIVVRDFRQIHLRLFKTDVYNRMHELHAKIIDKLNIITENIVNN